MAKKTKHNETKKTYTGLRSLFVAVWFTLVILLTHNDLMQNLLNQSYAKDSNLIIVIILLAPIAIVVFPLMYRLDDIYGISEKKVPVPVWKRSVIGAIGTSAILGIILYLFMITTFSLFYSF